MRQARRGRVLDLVETDEHEAPGLPGEGTQRHQQAIDVAVRQRVTVGLPEPHTSADYRQRKLLDAAEQATRPDADGSIHAVIPDQSLERLREQPHGVDTDGQPDRRGDPVSLRSKVSGDPVDKDALADSVLPQHRASSLVHPRHPPLPRRRGVGKLHFAARPHRRNLIRSGQERTRHEVTHQGSALRENAIEVSLPRCDWPGHRYLSSTAYLLRIERQFARLRAWRAGPCSTTSRSILRG